jgi:hypothetical protein
MNFSRATKYISPPKKAKKVPKTPELILGSRQSSLYLNIKTPSGPAYLVWGTGETTGRLLGRLGYRQRKRIIGFVETVPKRKKVFGRRIYKPEQILQRFKACSILVTSSYIKDINRSKVTMKLRRGGFRLLQLLPPAFADFYRNTGQRIPPPAVAKSNNWHMRSEWSQDYIKFSVIIPTYNSDVFYLRQALNSIIYNSYPYYEIIITDDGSTRIETIQYIESIERSGNRIRVIRNEGGLGISENTNVAIRRADGDYYVFVDHDDRLHEAALEATARAIIDNPTKRYFFSDEDKITVRGTHFSPYLKAGFDPLLLRVQNCISHLSVVEADTVRELGGLDARYDGSQDWALAVSVYLKYGGAAFCHIPSILYHWRTVPQSAANGEAAKPWAVQAGQKLIRDKMLSKLPHVQLIPHPSTSFNRLYLSEVPPINIHFLSFQCRGFDGEVNYEGPGTLNLGIQRCYEMAALDRGLDRGMRDSYDYSFLYNVVSSLDATELDYLLVLPSCPMKVSAMMIKELYTVSFFSESGISTGALLSNSKDLSTELITNRYSSNHLASSRPNWLLTVQRSIDKCWLDFLFLPIARVQGDEILRRLLLGVGRRIESASGAHNMFGFTPFVQAEREPCKCI